MAFVVDKSVVPKRVYDEDRGLQICHGPSTHVMGYIHDWAHYQSYFVHKLGDKTQTLDGACMVGFSSQELTEEQKAEHPGKKFVDVHTIFDSWGGLRGVDSAADIWIRGYSRRESVEILNEALAAIFYSKPKKYLDRALYEFKIAPKYQEMIDKGEG